MQIHFTQGLNFSKAEQILATERTQYKIDYIVRNLGNR